MKPKVFGVFDVHHIVELAHIPVSAKEKESLAEGFTKALEVVDQLAMVDVTGVSPIYQVTGITNVMREDEVDATRTFTQEHALQNAKATYNGFFMVEQVVEQE